jgi:hypothetical protein
MSLDVKRQRLFIAALGNNAVEVIDLKAGKRVQSRRVAVIDREKPTVVANWETAMAFANYPMSLDEADHRLFVVTRLPARLLIFDTNTGKVIQKLATVGDCDDVFYDQKRKRTYASGGDGKIAALGRSTSFLGTLPASGHAINGTSQAPSWVGCDRAPRDIQ